MDIGTKKRLGTSRPPREPKLLERVRHTIRTRHYSRATEKAYIGWIRRYILYHGKRHPSEMGEHEIRALLTHLAADATSARPRRTKHWPRSCSCIATCWTHPSHGSTTSSAPNARRWHDPFPAQRAGGRLPEDGCEPRQRYAASHDRAFTNTPGQPERFERVPRIHRLWFTPFFAARRAPDSMKGNVCAGSPASLKNKQFVDQFTFASLGDWDWTTSLRNVTTPTLIIHGELDPLPIESARKWATAMPNARLLELNGIGHFPYVEAADAFFAAVHRFLQGEWPEGTTR